MTRPKQKTEEYIYAKRAASLLGEAWDIKDPESEQDWPDLVVRLGCDTFGLEVREIYADEERRGSPKRRGESHRERALERAADEYYKGNAIPVRVLFYGEPSDATRLAEKVAWAVQSLEIWGNRRVTLAGGRWMCVLRLPIEVGDYRRWMSVSDSVGWVGTADCELIQKTIGQKAENLNRYHKHLCDVRLLLVADRTRNSGKLCFANTKELDTAGFDRIHLMSYPEDIIRIPAESGT